MQTIEVVIDAEGSVTVETKGIKGSGCQAFSRAVEQAIGKTTGEVKKPEFFISSNSNSHATQS